MIDNNFALQVSGVGNCEIRNNYIKSKDICIKFMQEVTGLISSNEIESKNTAIYALISCDINIQENNIYAVTGILFRELYTNGNINGNNLFCDRYCIDYVTRDSGDMDAANNWWNTTNLDVIDAVINDKNDYLPSDTYYDAMSYVNYMPIRVGLNTNAGIK